MANVDSKLHNSGDPLDRVSETPKKSVRGAASGVFIGSRTTPNRTTDYVDGAGAGVATSSTRPTGRTMYRGDGVQGGSAVGFPAKRASNHSTSFDKRSSTTDGGVALGSDGRGTQTGVRGIARPAIGGSENPAVGTVAVIAGTGKFEVDMHADDVTNFLGAEVLCYERGTDTDEDGAFVGKVLFDSATKGDGLTSLAAATYAVYARFIENDGSAGPLSARGTVVVS